MDFIRKNPWIIGVVTLLLVVAVMVSTGQAGRVTWLESGLGTVFSPFQKMGHAISSWFQETGERWSERKTLSEDYLALKEEVDTLRTEIIRLEEVERENLRLKEAMDYISGFDVQYISGVVTGKNTGVWFNTFTVDRGRIHGVEKDMGVVNGKGLVGRVIEVGYNWCKVRTVMDELSSVSAIVERTRDQGMVQGSNGDANPMSDVCTMVYLPLDSDVQPGDRILTSGLDDVIPKGLLIGTVTSVERESRNFYLSAQIEPSVDFQHLENVLVVFEKEKEPMLPATPTPAVSPGTATP